MEWPAWRIRPSSRDLSTKSEAMQDSPNSAMRMICLPSSYTDAVALRAVLDLPAIGNARISCVPRLVNSASSCQVPAWRQRKLCGRGLWTVYSRPSQAMIGARLGLISSRSRAWR